MSNTYYMAIDGMYPRVAAYLSIRTKHIGIKPPLKKEHFVPSFFIKWGLEELEELEKASMRLSSPNRYFHELEELSDVLGCVFYAIHTEYENTNSIPWDLKDFDVLLSRTEEAIATLERQYGKLLGSHFKSVAKMKTVCANHQITMKLKEASVE